MYIRKCGAVMQQKKSIVICGIDEISNCKAKIIHNLDICTGMLKELLKLGDSLDFFKKAKYEKTVIDPFTGEAENLVEVINQCQTYLVSLMGAEYLISNFPDIPFVINLGNVAGYDIESGDGTIIAECFATTNYRSNGKLSKDLKRLAENDSAVHKYVFFYATEFTNNSKQYYENKYTDIKIVCFADVR